MCRCPNRYDAITTGHDTVLEQMREVFGTMDDMFEQHWCAKAGSLFPKILEKYPELRRCRILEVWKQPFHPWPPVRYPMRASSTS